jgi:hypothetical protein
MTGSEKSSLEIECTVFGERNPVVIVTEALKHWQELAGVSKEPERTSFLCFLVGNLALSQPSTCSSFLAILATTSPGR